MPRRRVPGRNDSPGRGSHFGVPQGKSFSKKLALRETERMENGVGGLVASCLASNHYP